MEVKMDANTTAARNMKEATEIFEKHTHTIRAAIRFHINDRSSIDDIFQDFFLSLVERPVPRRDQNIKAFINRAIRNDVLDVASQNRSYHQRNCKYAQMHKDRFKSKAPDEIVIHAEDIRQLFDIVENQLMHHESQAIIQKYQYDRDAGEAAEAMGITRRSVSHYLCTGMKKLRNFVCQEQFADEDCLVEADALT